MPAEYVVVANVHVAKFQLFCTSADIVRLSNITSRCQQYDRRRSPFTGRRSATIIVSHLCSLRLSLHFLVNNGTRGPSRVYWWYAGQIGEAFFIYALSRALQPMLMQSHICVECDKGHNPTFPGFGWRHSSVDGHTCSERKPERLCLCPTTARYIVCFLFYRGFWYSCLMTPCSTNHKHLQRKTQPASREGV